MITENTDTYLHKAVPGRPFLSLLRYNRPYWKAYVTGACLAFFVITIDLCAPLVIRQAIDGFEAQSMTSGRLWGYFGLLVAIAILTGFARYQQRTVMIRASRKFEYDLRNDYFRHVQSLSRDFFHRMKTGDIMARVTNDLNFVRMFVGPGVMGSVDMLRVPLTLAVMVYLSGRLTLIALLPLPFVSLLVYGFVMYMHHQSKRVQELFSVVTARVQENLAGARVVKAYGAADREYKAFAENSRAYMRENLKLNIVLAVAWPLIGFTVGITILIVLWQGGRMVIEGALSLGDFSGFIVCLLMLAFPLAEFGWVLTLYQRGAVGMNRLLEVLREAPRVRDGKHASAAFESLRGSITFEGVSFAYNGRPVLDHLDFTIDEGMTLAIVGPTGSGKSSIVNLITREYNPTAGRVLFDGISADRIPIKTLRNRIGIVPQDSFLFSDTIRNNLIFGKPDATEDEIRVVAEIAQFRETVDRLPRGYDTLLGERGVNLSGGQKQRLALARALIRDPRILILDDALSSVDTHTEEAILERLRAFMARRTSIIISHRVSTVRHADRILVIEDGRIVESGNHDALIEGGGLYMRMHERQRLEEQLEVE